MIFTCQKCDKDCGLHVVFLIEVDLCYNRKILFNSNVSPFYTEQSDYGPVSL